jgi:small-conductance mechanosensitive channel
MNLPELFLRYIQREETQLFGIRLGIFIVLVLLAFLAGAAAPVLLRILLKQLLPKRGSEIYEQLFEPIKSLLRNAVTLLLIGFSVEFLQDYRAIYGLLRLSFDIAVIVSVAWFCSRLFRQFVRTYGIEMLRKMGREVDEQLLVAEMVANVLIGFFAVLAFAKDRFDLLGLMAGFGLGGLAIAFAAQKTLEQLLGTVVLYLDRPFLPGEYIRLSDGLYGRVESIGLRSTKIRTAAKSTLVILPNSLLANQEIENITRGKKVMVLLYLDFTRPLEDSERALVQQAITDSTDSLFGIDPGSTSITLMDEPDYPGTRARVNFFILGSTETSVRLRKRLLELANETIASQLAECNIQFKMQEPTIYVESPIPL